MKKLSERMLEYDFIDHGAGGILDYFAFVQECAIEVALLEADKEEARNLCTWLWGATKHTPWVSEESDDALASDIEDALERWHKELEEYYV